MHYLHYNSVKIGKKIGFSTFIITCEKQRGPSDALNCCFMAFFFILLRLVFLGRMLLKPFSSLSSQVLQAMWFCRFLFPLYFVFLLKKFFSIDSHFSVIAFRWGYSFSLFVQLLTGILSNFINSFFLFRNIVLENYSLTSCYEMSII